MSELLDEALELEPAEREPWLSALASRDPGAADDIRALLARRDEFDAQGFLDGAVSPLVRLEALNAPLIGTRIGAYMIEGLIGRGGMGEVWLASRSDGQFEGRCAIKLLNSAAAGGLAAERVRDEGHLLARLSHPNIARLLDAGITSEGVQFLVLEYVGGDRIDHYCTKRALTIEARVRLFLDVVSAVAHAHSQLIIHRDLKPSNVLVTQEGVVKLLDFGVAKLMQSSAAPVTHGAAAIDAAHTPEYAAPEQLLGEAPSTATDVYQLGMLLYVLLTGRYPPQRAKNLAAHTTAPTAEPIPPASHFADRSRRRALRGDLDAILEMALRTDATQRYPAATALREELTRYLNGEPVNARRGAPFYRTRKFVLRYRVGVAASATAILAMCVAALVAFQQASSARSERDRALALATRNEAMTDFLGVLITEAAETGAPVTVNDMLASSERLAFADSNGPAEDRAAVLEMIAARYASLGDDARAVDLLTGAKALMSSSTDRSLKSKLACALALSTASLGHVTKAVQAIEEELKQLKSDSQNAAYCLLDRALVADNANDAENALRYAMQALAQFRTAPQTSADEGAFLGAVAIGYQLNRRNVDAEDYYRQALGKYRALGREGSPAAITLRNNWAVMYDHAGMPQESLRLLDEALRIVTERNPGNSPPAYLIGNRAHALESAGRYEEAEAAFLRALELAHQQHMRFGDTYYLLSLAATELDLHRLDRSSQYLREAVATLKPGTATQSSSWASRAMTAVHIPARPLAALIEGRLKLARGDASAARLLFLQVLNGHEARVDIRVEISALGSLIEASLGAGDPAQAATHARNVLQKTALLGGGLPYSLYTGEAWLLLGLAEQQLGNLEQAQQAFAAAIRHLSRVVGDMHPLLIWARKLAASNA